MTWPTSVRGPQGKGERRLQWAHAEHGVANRSESLGIELGRSAASLTRIKLAPAAAAVRREPPEHGTQIDAHGACHRLRVPSFPTEATACFRSSVSVS